MSWDQIQLWLLGAAVVLGVLSLFHKYRRRQQVNEQYPQSPDETRGEASSPTLERMGKIILGWPMYVAVGALFLINYSIDQEQYELLLAMFVIAAVIASVVLFRRRRLKERVPYESGSNLTNR